MTIVALAAPITISTTRVIDTKLLVVVVLANVDVYFLHLYHRRNQLNRLSCSTATGYR